MTTITGGLRSTRNPPTTAVVQLPATSQTGRVLVLALAVSVPAGTLVESEKSASDVLARPDAASVAVQATLTSVGCHRPSAAPHATAGGV